VSAGATPAIDIVRRAGVDHRIHEYDLPERHGKDRDARPAYGLEAADVLGVTPDRMFKTLVASVDDRLVMAIVPVDRELDLKRLASAVGGRSPLGSRRPLPVVADASMLEHETVFVSAGRRGLQLELAPTDLVRLSKALSARVARDERHG